MNDIAVKTLAKALNKSVAGQSTNKNQMVTRVNIDAGGPSEQPKEKTEGPFTFDYGNLDELRKAFNRGDDVTLAKLLPDNTTFINRKEISEEELQKNASDYVEQKYAPEEEKVNLSADKNVLSLQEKLQKAESSAQSDVETAEKNYLSGVEKTKDGVLRQGMLHSSVYEGLMDRLDNTLSGEIQRVEQELAATTQSINVQIEYVEAERTRALKEYDLKKAEEYGKKLDALRSAEYAARKEVVAYNREISAWKNDIAKARRQYAEQILVDAAKKGLFVY